MDKLVFNFIWGTEIEDIRADEVVRKTAASQDIHVDISKAHSSRSDSYLPK